MHLAHPQDAKNPHSRYLEKSTVQTTAFPFCPLSVRNPDSSSQPGKLL